MIKHNQLKSLEFLKEEQEVCENTNQENYWIKVRLRVSSISAWTCSYLPILSSAWQVPFLIGVAKNLGTLSPAQSRAGVSVGGTGCQLFSPHLQLWVAKCNSRKVWSGFDGIFIYLAIFMSIEAVTQARQAKSTGTHYFHPSFLISEDSAQKKQTQRPKLPFLLDAHLVVSFWESRPYPSPREVA